MAASEAIIGEEWKGRASEQGRSYKAMTLSIASMRGQDMVPLDKLARHFASRRQHRPQLIGLHAESKEGTSRWLAIDIDNHDLEAVGAPSGPAATWRGPWGVGSCWRCGATFGSGG
jgi:hypothetical protein